MAEGAGRAADLRARAGATFGTLVAQLFFIATGVYLGNQADDWKQAREHRQAARSALESFRAEMVTNRDRLARYAPIYSGYADSMRVSEGRGDAAPRSVREVFRRLGWKGLNPVTFDRTAWDLALATQSLNYVPRPLAFRIARVYTGQQQMHDFQRDVGSALFSPAALDDAHVFAFLLTFGAYVEDSMIMSRQMAAGYGRMIPAVDSALARLPE